MPERFEIYTAYKWCYINALPFLSLPYSCSATNIILAKKITDRSFHYASPCLWNQLPMSLHQPHSGTSLTEQ